MKVKEILEIEEHLDRGMYGMCVSEIFSKSKVYENCSMGCIDCKRKVLNYLGLDINYTNNTRVVEVIKALVKYEFVSVNEDLDLRTGQLIRGILEGETGSRWKEFYNLYRNKVNIEL